MASAKFFRKQAEKCAGMARRTHDEDSRQRCEQLERTYCYLAEVEEREADDPERRPGAKRTLFCCWNDGLARLQCRGRPPLSGDRDILKRNSRNRSC